jgi:hypothetical protein
VDDERVGDLNCHKLKLVRSNLSDREIPLTSGSFDYLWLARDRNLLPVRFEQHFPKVHEIFPREATYVEDLREIRSGVWYPHRTTTLRFREYGDLSGLCENRLIVNTRICEDVKKLTVNLTAGAKLFSQIEAPKGTVIWVYDERNKELGEHKLSADGNIDLSPEELSELKQEAKH